MTSLWSALGTQFYYLEQALYCADNFEYNMELIDEDSFVEKGALKEKGISLTYSRNQLILLPSRLSDFRILQLLFFS